MAGAIRNSCVARGVLATTGNTYVYTVPTGKNLILKDVRLENWSGGTNTMTIYVIDQVSTAAILLLAATSPATDVTDWSGWIVLNPGDNIRIGNSGEPTHYWLSGALLPFA